MISNIRYAVPVSWRQTGRLRSDNDIKISAPGTALVQV